MDKKYKIALAAAVTSLSILAAYGAGRAIKQLKDFDLDLDFGNDPYLNEFIKKKD